MASAEWKQCPRFWVSCRDCGYLTPSPVSLSWFGTDSVSEFLARPGTWTKALLLSDYHCFQPIVTFLSGFRSAERRAQEMVYRPLRLGSGVWKSKVNYWYPETECCDDHEAGHEWSDNVCLEMGDVTRYCYDIHCCPVTERNSSPSAGSRHDLPA